jgi:recA bacterial DNA recombination protein
LQLNVIMRTAFSKAELENEIAGRFGDAFRLHEKLPPAMLSTGIPEVDALTGGVPRGAISEISGSVSSGRTSLMFSLLAQATTNDEVCALIDTNDVFTPTMAAIAGIDFDRLLWIRCANNLEHAFKATDLLLHAGGFGLVVLDIGDVAAKDARRIISSWWYRFRRTVENKPTSVIVISQEACTRSCALLTLELKATAEWSTAGHIQNNVYEFSSTLKTEPSVRVTHANLLRGNEIKIERRRPIIPGCNESRFQVRK